MKTFPVAFFMARLYNLSMTKMDINVNQNTRQEMRLTHEMIQTLKVLQMDTLELRDFVAQQLTGNPVLEEQAPESSQGVETELSGLEYRNLREAAGRDESEWNSAEDDGYDDGDDARNDFGALYTASSGAGTGRIEEFEQFIREDETLTGHLTDQLRTSPLHGAAYRACEYMIGSLDQDGYLVADEAEILNACGGTKADVSEALTVLQSMDPAGVGARNLPECLRIQLRTAGMLTAPMERMIDGMMEDLAANRIPKIAKELGVSKREVQQMVDLLRRMNPNPGSLYGSGRPQPAVIPDVILNVINGTIEISLNEESVPGVRISPYYRELMQTKTSDPELRKYLTSHFQSAGRLIDNIHRREETILRICNWIAARQQSFFCGKSRDLRPLTMQEAADDLGIHVSTVSRAVNGKYLQCACGIYALRAFFESGLGTRDEGAEMGKDVSGDGAGDMTDESKIASASVKSRIHTLVRNEDPKHPLSDQKIVDALESEGIRISRRTVAKYREQEGIPAAPVRRRYE